jgi:hypothetical protein
MTSVQKLRDILKAERNPGHEIGTFLIGHSNSPAYLVSQLEAYLEAARADLEAERSMFRKLAGGRLRMLADWQLREEGHDPDEVTRQCLEEDAADQK